MREIFREELERLDLYAAADRIPAKQEESLTDYRDSLLSVSDETGQSPTIRIEFRSGRSLPDDHPAKRLRVEIEDAFYEALEFPNEWLPAKLRDRKNKRRSIRFLQKAVERKERKASQRDVDKMEKANRIADYRHQVTWAEFGQDTVSGIRYREDEHRVYAAHLRFCRIVGLVTQEDIDNQ